MEPSPTTPNPKPERSALNSSPYYKGLKDLTLCTKAADAAETEARYSIRNWRTHFADMAEDDGEDNEETYCYKSFADWVKKWQAYFDLAEGERFLGDRKYYGKRFSQFNGKIIRAGKRHMPIHPKSFSGAVPKGCAHGSVECCSASMHAQELHPFVHGNAQSQLRVRECGESSGCPAIEGFANHVTGSPAIEGLANYLNKSPAIEESSAIEGLANHITISPAIEGLANHITGSPAIEGLVDHVTIDLNHLDQELAHKIGESVESKILEPINVLIDHAQVLAQNIGESGSILKELVRIFIPLTGGAGLASLSVAPTASPTWLAHTIVCTNAVSFLCCLLCFLLHGVKPVAARFVGVTGSIAFVLTFFLAVGMFL